MANEPLRYARVGDHQFLAPMVATQGSAGIDLYATVDANIPGGEVVKVGTGWAFAIPPGWCGIVLPRSGAGTKLRVKLANTAGIIDSDYRGEVILALSCEAPFAQIQAGKPIAQMIVVQHWDWGDSFANGEVSLKELGETARGAGGFGSTG